MAPPAAHQRRITGLADKRIAIIGTGQLPFNAFPMLASGEAYVFQRTPSSIYVRGMGDQPRLGRITSSGNGSEIAWKFQYTYLRSSH